MSQKKPGVFTIRKILPLLTMVLLFAALPLRGDRKSTEEAVAPGCTLMRIQDTDRVLMAYILKVDLHRSGLRIEAVLAKDGLEGRETVPDMARRFDRPGHRVLAAVNGDFVAGSAPSGLSVFRGRLIRVCHGWSSLVFARDNRPSIGVFRHELSLTVPDGTRLSLSLNRARRADGIGIYTDVFGKAAGAMTDGRSFLIDPGGHRISTRGEAMVRVIGPARIREGDRIPAGKWVLSFGSRRETDRLRIQAWEDLSFQSRIDPDPFPVHCAVGGGPRLLRSGRISVEREREGQRAGFANERHPRTAAGYSAGSRWLFLTVVEGRQPGRSRGVTLHELAEMMLSLGCAEALNLDGGGSSTMVAGGALVNRPSGPTGLRPVANALLVVDTGEEKPGGPLE